MSEDEHSGSTRKILSSPWTLWALIVFGVAFRIIQYWSNRSLWLDEAMLSSSILNRSYGDLLKPPLDYYQHSPIGFLWMERFFLSLIHPLEYGLRFFPLLCGIISVFAFWRLTRYLLAPIGQAAALSLFSCGHYLVYYSSEVKQYSTEVLVCVTLIWTGLRFREPAPTWGKTLLLGMLGAVTIWLSFSAVFVLAGIGASLVFFAMRNKNQKDLLLLLSILTLWAASFLVLYYSILRNTPILPQVMKEWTNLDGFWPFPPASISDLLWPWRALQTFIANPLGMEIIFPYMVLIAAGYWVLGRKAPFYCLVVCITVVVAIAAAALHRYPFGLRVILYLVPLALIGVGAAVDKIWEHLYAANTGLFLLIVLAVFYTPIKGGFHQALHPTVNTEIKPALTIVSQKARPGDGIYVYRYAMPTYLVYQNSYPALRHLEVYSTSLESGSPTQPEVDEQLRRIQAHAGRVWLLFAHTDVEEVSYRYYMRYFLDRIGRQVSSYEKDNVWLYLYAMPESGPAIGSSRLPPGGE